MGGIAIAAGRHLPPIIKQSLRNLAVTVFSYVNPGQVSTPDGHVFDVPLRMSPIDYFALSRGCYERSEIEVLQKHFKEEANTIIEIGSNIGVVACHAFEDKLADGGTYICVEPNPKSVLALEANMKRAQIAHPNRIYTIIRAAIGDPSLEGTFENFVVRPDLGSRLAYQMKAIKLETTVRVPMTSLSAIIRERNIKGSISLICDAEGAETRIIRNDMFALSKISQIAIEFHKPCLTGCPETTEDMLESLKKLNFHVGGRSGDTYYLSRRDMKSFISPFC